MSLRVTILGCGASGGVPRVGTMWGRCDPSNPRNRRRRCGLLVERLGTKGRTRVLIDTPPDLRDQLVETRVDWVDGVLYTHDHADHTHGIDDLRMVAYAMRKRVKVWADAATLQSLTQRFAYCFTTPTGSSYPPILDAHVIDPAKPIRFDGAGGVLEAVPIVQRHGDIDSLGFRFGRLGYSPDISDLPAESVPMLTGLDVWIVDALRYTPHPSHFHLRRALEWIDRLGAKRGILTHMTGELDYDGVRREVPDHVEPAYDGMVVEQED